jgi:hypothetical protein
MLSDPQSLTFLSTKKVDFQSKGYLINVSKIWHAITTKENIKMQ